MKRFRLLVSTLALTLCCSFLASTGGCGGGPEKIGGGGKMQSYDAGTGRYD